MVRRQDVPAALRREQRRLEERGVVAFHVDRAVGGARPARRIERVFGRTEGDYMLVDPVSIAVDRDGNVYVADRGLDAVLVFDRFGTYIRMLAEGIAQDVKAVYTRGERMFIVLPRRLSRR